MKFATILMSTFLAFPALSQVGEVAAPSDKVLLAYGEDPNIKIHIRGRSGNLVLNSSQTPAEGRATIDYQKGRGYMSFDRDNQVLSIKSTKGFSLNHMSRHVEKTAPSMNIYVPAKAELDFNLSLGDLGYGTMDFSNLSVREFRLNAKYGDVDVHFPTENQAIVRGTAKFHLMAGDLEVNQLGNLRAAKLKINSEAGELTVDFGPRIFIDTEAVIDHDFGNLDVIIPKGTRVIIRGTSRNLSKFGLVKVDKQWETETHSPNSPRLDIKMRGPLGDLDIIWK